MFSCLQILEAFLWFVLITLLNVTLIILTLSVSRLLNLLLRLVAFLLFLNPQCLASISRWITTVTQFCRKLAAERPLKDIRDEYNYPKKKGIKDECSRLLEASTMKSRRGFAIQRLMNAM